MPSSDDGHRGLLAHLPLPGTSLIVASVVVVAVSLVTGFGLTAAHAPAAPPSPSRPYDTRTAVLLPHPRATVAAIAPVTTEVAGPATTPTTMAPVVTTVPRPASVAHLSTAAPTTEGRPSPPPRPVPPPSRPAPSSTAHPVLPPDNPAADIPPSPAYSGPCVQDGFDSAPCIAAATQASARARAAEGLGPLELPSDYAALSAAEQLFVLTDIERVDRGLPPVVGMVAQFDADAQTGAEGNADPTPSPVPGLTELSWAANWAENTGPLGADYMWMYEDGPGSGNEECTASDSQGCWGHRDNILGFDAAQVAAQDGELVMGAAEATVAGDSPWSSDAELIVVVQGAPSFTYTWAQAEAAGAR